MPTERPPLVREVIAQLLRLEGRRVVSAADPLRPYSRLSRPARNSYTAHNLTGANAATRKKSFIETWLLGLSHFTSYVRWCVTCLWASLFTAEVLGNLRFVLFIIVRILFPLVSTGLNSDYYNSNIVVLGLGPSEAFNTK
jgi:hypothetical protein